MRKGPAAAKATRQREAGDEVGESRAYKALQARFLNFYLRKSLKSFEQTIGVTQCLKLYFKTLLYSYFSQPPLCLTYSTFNSFFIHNKYDRAATMHHASQPTGSPEPNGG